MNQQIKQYEEELADKDMQLYIKDMGLMEFEELFYSCIYPDGYPEEEIE